VPKAERWRFNVATNFVICSHLGRGQPTNICAARANEQRFPHNLTQLQQLYRNDEQFLLGLAVLKNRAIVVY
jgi:hypothetical protein